METLLAERPLLTSLMLAAVAFGLIYGWLQTGKKPAAIAGLVVLALIPFTWILAERWETDREQIESTIYQIADAVEANDHEAAVAVIADPQTRTQARIELQRWTFQLADVNKIRSIELISGTFPPEADVDMSVKVDVSEARGGQSFRVPRRLILKFVKEGDRWMVTDYQHMPITGGPDPYSTKPPSTP
jgi:ketosteroid isomerase-like protein